MKNQLIVTGTHTGIGKTLIATILALGLRAKYWKPIQTGSIEGTDSNWVGIQIGKENIIQESYCFRKPESPHSAAKAEGIYIDMNSIHLPLVQGPLIIEGAGGVLVPLNEEYLIVDLFQKLGIPVVLVSGLYLGAINHTLLSIEALKTRNIPIKGIIFSGNDEFKVKEIIEKFSRVPILGHVPQLNLFDANYLKECFERYIKMN